jgi:uncharacterized RDD family membrane protein YckC
MSSTQPPKDGDLPSGDSLWQILHDPGQLSPAAPPPAAPTPAAPRPPAQPGGAPVVERVQAPAPWQRSPGGAPPAAPADDTSGSLIQRILTAPEELGPDFEYRPDTVVETEDFDKALLNYYRDTGITVSCRNHPDAPASGGQCPACTAYYCQACMVVRRGRYLCRDCADALYVPSAEQVLTAHERGLEMPEHDVLPETYPQFQVGNELFGREGSPAYPAKQLLALLIDFVVVRALELIVLLVLSIFFSHTEARVFHLFLAGGDEPVLKRVIEASILLRPAVPWLIFFAVLDYFYFFFSLSLANRTIGMSWTGCRIVTEWGDFVGFSAVALRTLVFMICLGVPAILLGWIFPAYRGPHDYAAGTLVINYAGVKRVDVYETVQIEL